MNDLISSKIMENKILLIRGKRVMLDRDIASLYGVSTKRLNEQVKRNIKRFPQDFMFRLTIDEKEQVVAICDHLKILKFSPQLPYAFTEPGVAMLSSVINSETAIQVNIRIIRVFIRLREMIGANKELGYKFTELERKIQNHESDIQAIFEAIRRIMSPPSAPPKPKIGFRP